MNPSVSPPPIFPQQPMSVPPQSPTPSPQSGLPHAGVGRRILVLVVSIVFFLALATVSFASLSVYTNTLDSFTSKEQQKGLALFMYKLPLLPKTPEQILLAAVESNTELTTYNPEFSMSGSLSSSAVTIGSLDLKIQGPVDFSKDKQPSFDLTVDAGVSFAGSSYQTSGLLRKIDNKVYYKVTNLSDSIIDTYTSLSSGKSVEENQTNEEIKANLAEVFAKWAMYDISGIESEAREALDRRGRDMSIVDSTRRRAQDILLQDTILPEVVRQKDETIDNVSTYHLSFSPSKEVLRNTLRELYPAENRMDESVSESINQVVDAVTTLQVDAWFGKGDAMLRKLSVQTTVNLNTYYESLRSSPRLSPVLGMQSDLPISALGTMVNPVVSTSVVLTVRDIGKPVVIEAPVGALSTADYWQELSNATKTEAQKEAEAARKNAQDGFAVLSKELLKYYVNNNTYPASLSSISSSIDTSAYIYKRSTNGKDFILYIESENSGYMYSESTPYYGITSNYSYPHQLTKRDFDLL